MESNSGTYLKVCNQNEFQNNLDLIARADKTTFFPQ